VEEAVLPSSKVKSGGGFTSESVSMLTSNSQCGLNILLKRIQNVIYRISKERT